MSAAGMEPLRCLCIGAGARGRVYAAHLQLRPVAVAEPQASRREAFARAHSLRPEHCFTDWESALAAREAYGAQVCVIATPDREHCAPAVACAPLFAGVLLEKPMAVTEEDCERIAEAFRQSGSICAVCHVLRYTPANRKLKELCASGAIGEILSISHTEPVGCQHFAHSFVRGNWRREDTSTFSLLAKSCHDVDLISWWAGEEAVRVSSFGSLLHFRRDKKPKKAGSAQRCLDCPAQAECPYAAPRLYLPDGRVDTNWAQHLVDGQPAPDVESVLEALRTGPYGRCAYECDNDVADHQVVNFEFRSGATATFTMVATTQRMCERETKVYGSTGELSTNDPKSVRQFDFASWKETWHRAEGTDGAHGGGDQLTLDAFVAAVRTGDHSLVLTGAEESLLSHRLAFAAEASRRQGCVVSVHGRRRKSAEEPATKAAG